MLSVLCFSMIADVFSHEYGDIDVSHVDAVYMYDVTHGIEIFEHNSEQILKTSTSAKITMGLVLCEKLADRLDERVTVTSEMLEGSVGRTCKLGVGESVSIDSLLYLSLCGTYNDAAYVLAHVAFGSADKLVSEMNRKAYALGAKNTNYTNIIGYPSDSDMLTCAQDVFRIARAASSNELYMKYVSCEKYECDRSGSDVKYEYNRNELVYSNSMGYKNNHCFGMNAGDDSDGGWSVVTLVNDEDVEYIMVILGGKENEDGSSVYAYELAGDLADRICDDHNYVTVYKAGQEIGMTSIGLTALNTDDAVYLASIDLSVYIPRSVDPATDIKYTVTFVSDSIKAPIEAGTKIGTLYAEYDGRILGQCDLILKDSYERNAVMMFVDVMFNYTRSRAFVAMVVCFCISSVIFLIYVKVSSRRFDRHIRRRK